MENTDQIHKKYIDINRFLFLHFSTMQYVCQTGENMKIFFHLFFFQQRLVSLLPVLISMSSGGDKPNYDDMNDKPAWWPDEIGWTNPKIYAQADIKVV